MSERGRGGGRGPRGGGRGGRIAPGKRPVSESCRLDIAVRLREFKESAEKELAFPPGLSNDDRAVVHTECKKHGFTSKSYGKGDDRYVTVFKPKLFRPASHALAYDLPLCAASQAALAQFTAAHPPTDAELLAASRGALPPSAGGGEAGEAGGGGGGGGGGGRGARRGAPGDAAAASSPELGADIGAAAGRMSPADVAAAAAAHAARLASPGLAAMCAQRAALPVASHRAAIVAAVDGSQVTVVAGETGCGKTTQVPQYLLEAAWAAGRPARIVCTQPRRLSAVSVADRVAAERGGAPGDAHGAGYAIRLETRGCATTTLLFCTTGVLLRRLTQAGAGGAAAALAGTTHVVLDEVHERDLNSDFLLTLLRDALPSLPGLRVVLMSATLDDTLFRDYFGGPSACPLVSVPGFTHPVADFFLGDVLSAVGLAPPAAAAAGGAPAAAPAAAAASRSRHHAPPDPSAGPHAAAALLRVAVAVEAAFLVGDDDAFEALLEAACPGGTAGAPPPPPHPGLVNARHGATGATPLHAACGQGREDVAFALLLAGADASAPDAAGAPPPHWARRFGHPALAAAVEAHAAGAAVAAADGAAAAALAAYQRAADPDEVDLGLIERLVAALHASGGRGDVGPGQPGAILVFLPGWDDIARLRDRLEAHGPGGPRGLLVLPLHSGVPPAEQRRVFARPPPGVRKVVLATNIAETSVTVDDVVFVIDSGRLKEKSYDAHAGVATLQAAWLPEMKRSPLEELVLQVKLLQQPRGGCCAAAAAGAAGGSAAAFLARALEPPHPAAVAAALAQLRDIGALAPGARSAAGAFAAPGDERLTRLGRHLAALPLHPRTGKMLLFARLFRCLGPCLSVAAAGSGRPPFLTPADPAARRAADAARAALAAAAGGGSDHLACAAAAAGWADARARGGAAGERAYCARHALSPGAMAALAGVRAQLEGALRRRGLGPLAGFAGYGGVSNAGGGGNCNASTLAPGSEWAGCRGVVRAALLAGLYPLVGTLLPAAGHPRPTLATLRGDRVRVAAQSCVCAAALRPSPPAAAAAAAAPASPAGGPGPGGVYGRGPPPPACVAFDEVTRGEAFAFVRDCTAAPPHALLLVCASLRVEEDDEGGGDDGGGEGDGGGGDVAMAAPPPPRPPTAVLAVDGSALRLRVPHAAAAALAVLRLRLAAAFDAAVDRPDRPLPPPLAAAVAAAAALLAAEGGDALPGGSAGAAAADAADVVGEGGGAQPQQPAPRYRPPPPPPLPPPQAAFQPQPQRRRILQPPQPQQQLQSLAAAAAGARPQSAPPAAQAVVRGGRPRGSVDAGGGGGGGAGGDRAPHADGSVQRGGRRGPTPPSGVAPAGAPLTVPQPRGMHIRFGDD